MSENLKRYYVRRLGERPARLKAGNVTLDADSWALAKRLGNGNISLGIRRALAMLEDKEVIR